jgi:prefoldin alpha subunit
MKMDDTEIQMLDHQIKQIQQVLENIDAQLIEINNIKDSLTELGFLKGTEEALFPIANGIFVSGKLTDNSMVKINVGSNVMVEKTIEESILMMHQQAKDIEDYRNQLIGQLDKLIHKMEGR